MNVLAISIGIFFIIGAGEAKILPRNLVTCREILGEELIEEIASYENVKDQIINYVTKGDFTGIVYDDRKTFTVEHRPPPLTFTQLGFQPHASSGVLDTWREAVLHYIFRPVVATRETIIFTIVCRTYTLLAKFVDKFGARPSGSKVLEKSIDYMIQLSKDEDLKEIYTEDVEVPRWVRIEENITMLEPRVKNIALLGLGYSVSSPPEGITAEVIVVKDFKKLEELKYDEVNGKIVLYDPTFTSYRESVIYRSQGASKAAKKGAVASLVKSITPFSINSPHTGSQTYEKNVTNIPTAAITLEDADLIRRMQDRGEKIVLNIRMSSTLDMKTSRNTLIDLKGTEKPEKLVIVSGHIDSWDVGQGAMDDGGGLFVSWAVPVILKRLNLRPKRTIRSIFWTGEELGLVGAYAYEEKHRNESHNINFIMESDEGTFSPRGLTVGGTQEAKCIVAEVLKLFESINASTLVEDDSPGSDIAVIVETGVPGAGLYNANEKYFWFHHSEGDTMNVESSEELDMGAAFWTAVAYIIADISADIPR